MTPTTPPAGWTWIDNQAIDAAPTLGAVAVVVYLVLARLADNEERTCYPSIPTIAKKAGVCERAVRAALRRLEAAVLLETSRRRGERGNTSNLYRLPTIPPMNRRNEKTPGGGTKVHQPPARNDTTLGHESTGELDPGELDPSELDPKKQRGCAAEIPPALDTEGFRAKWGEWLAYRRERRLTLTPRTLTKQLTALAGFGLVGAIQSVDASIEAGWQGLFPPKDNGHGSRNHRGGVCGGHATGGDGAEPGRIRTGKPMPYRVLTNEAPLQADPGGPLDT